MRDYAIMDVETTMLKDGERPKTKFWGYYDGTNYRTFERTSQFLKFLRQQPPKTILHHANFDVIQLLMDGADMTILKSHNNRLIKCALGEHYTINTYSCFPISLVQVFKAFGHKKTDLGQLAKRNYDDCVLGLECFLKLDEIFISLVGVSPLEKGTIAATGFSAAEKSAGKMPKDLRFLEAYRGGRVDVFDTRETYCSKWDINSSYPASIIDCPEKSQLLYCEVRTHDNTCPFFDAGNDEMLLFPNGKFRTWIYQDVLTRYISPNCEKTSIKVLKKVTINFEWLNRLKPLVETVYDKKQNSDGGVRLVCKFVLNSLYGRMGLKGESERARVLPFPVDGDDVSCSYIGKNRWLVFDKVTRECRSNYPFAAYITDNARGRLYESFVKNNALYGDTDSIFTKKTKQNFDGQTGENLGKWKYEGRDNLKAQNIKDYVFGDDEVRKGGSDFMQWTIKDFASGRNVSSVQRTRRTGLRKRLVLPNGETVPLIVGK